MGQTREGFFSFKTFGSLLDLDKIDHEANRLGQVEYSDQVYGFLPILVMEHCI